jgi:hypothetical protein
MPSGAAPYGTCKPHAVRGPDQLIDIEGWVLGRGRTTFVHALNGTALAVSRILIALLESFHREDASVRIAAKRAHFFSSF